jgi:hypothetical protein
MKLGPIVLLALAAVCFALLLADQLSSGDLYSRASSLRTDQQGSSAYFEALARTHAKVDRNYAPVESLASSGEAPKADVVLLGMHAVEFKQAEMVDAITALAKAGSRVVITLDGSYFEVIKPAHWDLEMRPVPREKKKDGDSDDENDTDNDIAWPEYIAPARDWRVAKSEAGKAVAVERAFGKGEIALIAATQPFLNEDLRTSRDIELLEWAAGNRQEILFDESHLGSAEGGTVMGLLRRFRLQGLMAALIAAALLFVWRASMPFPPVPDAADDTVNATPRLFGTGSGEALRNLLERRIPRASLVKVCVAEWERDFARRAGEQAVREATQAAAENAPEAERWEKIRGIVRGTRTS